MSEQRRRQLSKILSAERELESWLLQLTKHGFTVSNLNPAFHALYYIVRLARRKP